MKIKSIIKNPGGSISRLIEIRKKRRFLADADELSLQEIRQALKKGLVVFVYSKKRNDFFEV